MPGTVRSPPDCPSATYPNLTWQGTLSPPPGGSGWIWPARTLLEFHGDNHQTIITDLNAWNLFMQFVIARGWPQPFPLNYKFQAP